MKLSVVVITRNEANNIERCLESVLWAGEIMVVDSGSTDSTVSLARKYTDRIIDHPFTDFSSQKNFAISQASGKWILILDADEVVSPQLAVEIQITMSSNNPERVYRIPRQTYFFGKPLHFSGTQNDAPIRLFPKGKAEFYQPVHEEIRTELPLAKLEAPLLHYTTRDAAHYQEKLKKYIPLELETMKLGNRPKSFLDLLIRPILKFLKQYFLDLGILDGWIGFVYAYLSAYYTALKYYQYLRSS